MFTAMYVEYQYSLHKCRSCCRAPTTFNWPSSELACTFFVLSHSLAEFVCEQLVCLGDTFGDTFHDNFDKSTLTGVIDGRIVSTSWQQTKPSLLSDTPSLDEGAQVKRFWRHGNSSQHLQHRKLTPLDLHHRALREIYFALQEYP